MVVAGGEERVGTMETGAEAVAAGKRRRAEEVEEEEVEMEVTVSSAGDVELTDAVVGPLRQPTASELVLAPFDGTSLGTRVPLSQLRRALVDCACRAGSGWGVSVGDLEAVLQPGVFGAAAEERGLAWSTFFNRVLHLLNR